MSQGPLLWSYIHYSLVEDCGHHLLGRLGMAKCKLGSNGELKVMHRGL